MTTGLQVGSTVCTCGHRHHDTRLVAVTGGPGAGKTAVLELALRSFCNHVGVLPEAASIVFGGGFPRHDSDVALRAAQRAIYHVQREQEALVIGEREVAVALCDRGTADGLAYWPDEPSDYWSQVHTTLEGEIARYSAVIHLRTPSADQGYNHQNVLRTESAAQARELDERILQAWESHPNRLVISAEEDFLSKATHALQHIRAALPRCCHSHPIPGEPAAE